MRCPLMILLAATLGLLFSPSVSAGPFENTSGFRPDIYPSKVLAISELGRPVAEALQGSRDFGEAGAIIEVVCGNVCDEAVDGLAHVLRTELPGAKVTIIDGYSDHESHRATTHPASIVRISPSVSSASNRVALTVTGGGIDRTFDARFVEKPWAADFNAFVSQDSQKGWVLGQTPRPAASEAEALELARQNALDALVPIIRHAGSRTGPESTVRYVLAGMLRQGQLIEDTFVQKFERPYGSVYRASLLVHASPENIAQIAGYTARTAQAQNRAQAVSWASAAGFFAVIFLLYLLINSLTRGYFIWRLRAAALLLSIVGILIVLAVT